MVGLHRPRIDDPEFASLPPEKATRIYRRVLSDIENYLDEMEVPEPIIQSMVATSSSDIRWVDAIADQLSRPPSYAEWEDASWTSRNTRFGRALAVGIEGDGGDLAAAPRRK